MTVIGKDFELIPYESRYLRETLNFLKKWSPEHPELADPELFAWQRGRRHLVLFQGRIVGHMTQIPHTFKTRKGVPIEIGWGATLVLDTSNPLIQMFAGTALLDQVTKNTPLRFAGVGVVPEIEETHKRRGYIVTRKMVKMYARFLNPAKALSYLNRSPSLSPLIKIVNLIRRRWRSPLSGNIQPIERFNPEWDGIWDKLLAEQYDFYGTRTADFLNYKLIQPQKKYTTMVYAAPEGSMEGYIIHRLATNRVKNIRLLKICDLVGTPPAKDALLGSAFRAALESRADGLVGLGSNLDQHVYRRSGMWIRKEYPVVLPPDIEGDIHVTFFDSDLDDLW